MNIPKPYLWPVMCLPWLVAAGLLLYVFALRFPPDGRFEVAHAFDGSGIWFTPFEPGERVSSPGAQEEGWRGQRILNEPVYASARWPGAYDELELGFEMKTIRQPLVEIGLLRDPETRAFEMRPLWSDALASDEWREVEVGERHGFVRADLPDEALLESDPRHLMVWHATATDMALEDAGPAEETSHDITLRGAHTFFLLPVDGRVRFSLALQDVNRNREGKNTFALSLSCGADILWTAAGGASGLNDIRPSDVFEETIDLGDLPPCAYRVSFIADNDFFIRGIRTTAKHWVIGPQIFFGDRVGYRATSTPAIAWTNSLHAVADTFHEDGKQEVSFGSAKTSIRATHDRYALARDPAELDRDIRFEAPNGNVRVIGDGYFALEESALFFPSPRRLTAESDPAKEGIRAVLTPYKKPVPKDGAFSFATAAFDVSGQGDKLQFSLAAPGIDRTNGAVDIRRVSLAYSRPPLTIGEWFERMKQEIRLALARL